MPVIKYGAGYKNWISYPNFTGVWCRGTGVTWIVPPDIQRSIDAIVLGAIVSMEARSRLDITIEFIPRAYFTIS